MNWVEYRGNSKRTYKNCLAFVVPHRQQMDKARTSARTYAAIASLLDQKSKYKFSGEDLSELKEKLNNAKNTLKAAVDRLYESIILPIPDREGENPITLKTIDLQSQLNTSHLLQDRVLDALRNDVFTTLTVNKLVRLSGLSSNRHHTQISALLQAFFQYPDYPKLLDEQPIKQAILEAINQGLFGYIPQLTFTADHQPIVDYPEQISVQTAIPSDELDSFGYLLEKDYVTELLAAHQAQKIVDLPIDPPAVNNPWSNDNPISIAVNDHPKPFTVEKPGNSTVEKSVLVDIVEGRQPAKRYELSAKLKSEQLFELVTILQNLPEKSSLVDIKVTVTAYAKDQFDLNWLKGAIEEPLDEADIHSTTKIT
ncbi:hypothetical protein NON20_25195 (plasmid) [Synechocystis sp. B12]|nr:hypothetical protein NON20_25195 [Synechocystis sp. B12]